MKRRSFIKNMLTLSVMSPALSTNLFAELSPYSGPIFITVKASGGLDQSSLSDPKNNETINSWAKDKSYGVAGNIRYAPIGDNKLFFDKYHKYMLVINGIDIQTNSHTAATRNRYTGRLAAGYPNIAETISFHKAQGYPLSYVSGGGYQQNLGYVPYSKLPSKTEMEQLSDTNNRYEGNTYLKRQDADKIAQARQSRINRLQADGDLLPRRELALRLLQQSFSGRELMTDLQELLPETIDTEDLQGTKNRIVSQAHQALIAAQAGLTSCIDLTSSNGFDSHSNHDSYFDTAYPNFTNGIDYIWSKAEELGIADRIIMHITSDVGRTPRYNSGNGKDHWRHTSSIFMKKDASWGNRVVGASDDGHYSLKINPTTLQIDEDGVTLEPKHIVQAQRQLAGIENSALAQKYPLDAEEINFFSTTRQTGYSS